MLWQKFSRRIKSEFFDKNFRKKVSLATNIFDVKVSVIEPNTADIMRVIDIPNRQPLNENVEGLSVHFKGRSNMNYVRSFNIYWW